MSSPTSIKLAPPTYIDPRVRRRNLWWYILLIWVSLIPAAIVLYWFFYKRFISLISVDLPSSPFSVEQLYSSQELMPLWLFAFLSPLVLVISYFMTIIWTALLTKFGLFLLKLIHHPIEGVFFRNLKDKDYYFWNCRNLMRIFLFWLLHSIPITWGKVFFSYRFFGVQIGKKSFVHHCWISPEFLSIGKNVMIGQAAGVYSFQFEADKLLVAKVEIHDNVIIGPQTVILPGSIIEKDIELEGNSFCHPFTHLSKPGYYSGQPLELIQKPKKNKK